MEGKKSFGQVGIAEAGCPQYRLKDGVDIVRMLRRGRGLTLPMEIGCGGSGCGDKFTDPVGLPDGFKLLLIVWKLIWTELNNSIIHPAGADDGDRRDPVTQSLQLGFNLVRGNPTAS